MHPHEWKLKINIFIFFHQNNKFLRFCRVSQRQWQPSFGNPSHGAAPSDNNLHSGEGFKLSGSKMVKNKMKLRVATHSPQMTRSSNPIPMLSKVLEMALLLDPTSCLKAPKSSLSPIMAVNEIPKDDKIFAYAFDLQWLATKKQFVFFILLETSIGFNDLKLNSSFFTWLMKNKFYLGLNTLEMNFTSPLSFLFGIHPTLSSHDSMKEMLDSYMDGIEYTLVPTSNFYIDGKGNCVNTRCIELQVDSDKVNEACKHISSAWMDPEFLKELGNCLIGKTIKFIPYIKKGIMSCETFLAALAQQHKFNNNTMGISVVRIGGLKVEVNCNNNMVSLVQMISSLKDTSGAVFNNVEPTKLMAAKGQFIFLTQKPIANKAEKLLDQLFKQLAREGHLDAFTMEGHRIHHLNQVQSKTMIEYAEGLAAKFKPWKLSWSGGFG